MQELKKMEPEFHVMRPEKELLIRATFKATINTNADTPQGGGTLPDRLLHSFEGPVVTRGV